MLPTMAILKYISQSDKNLMNPPALISQTNTPMSVNIHAASGCDYVLFGMAEKLTDVGILNTALTGKLAFWGDWVEQTLGSGMLGTEKNFREGFSF